MAAHRSFVVGDRGVLLGIFDFDGNPGRFGQRDAGSLRIVGERYYHFGMNLAAGNGVQDGHHVGSPARKQDAEPQFRR